METKAHYFDYSRSKVTSATTVGLRVSAGTFWGLKSMETASVTGVAITFCTGTGFEPELSRRSFTLLGSEPDGNRPKSTSSCCKEETCKVNPFLQMFDLLPLPFFIIKIDRETSPLCQRRTVCSILHSSPAGSKSPAVTSPPPPVEGRGIPPPWSWS